MSPILSLSVLCGILVAGLLLVLFALLLALKRSGDNMARIAENAQSRVLMLAGELTGQQELYRQETEATRSVQDKHGHPGSRTTVRGQPAGGQNTMLDAALQKSPIEASYPSLPDDQADTSESIDIRTGT